MCEPPPAAMLFAIVEDVAALAERGEVPRSIVGRIMIEMRGRQNYARCAKRCGAVRSL